MPWVSVIASLQLLQGRVAPTCREQEFGEMKDLQLATTCLEFWALLCTSTPERAVPACPLRREMHNHSINKSRTREFLALQGSVECPADANVIMGSRGMEAMSAAIHSG